MSSSRVGAGIYANKIFVFGWVLGGTNIFNCFCTFFLSDAWHGIGSERNGSGLAIMLRINAIEWTYLCDFFFSFSFVAKPKICCVLFPLYLSLSLSLLSL